MKHPLGLAKDGQLLFLCDEKDGLKLYNADDPLNLKLLWHITDCTPIDVIAAQGLALVLAKEGLYEYDYSNPQKIVLKGKLTLSN
jgi:hypothetical protein